MRRTPLAALLRLLIIAGGVTFVNPYASDRIDLNQVWVEIPSSLVALGGDVHVRVHGVLGTGLRVRLAREDDEGRTLLATMPLALDSESRMTIPCGYFSRGGIYYLELIADKENFINEDYNAENLTNNVLDDVEYTKRHVRDDFEQEKANVNNVDISDTTSGANVESKDPKESFTKRSINTEATANYSESGTHDIDNNLNTLNQNVDVEIPTSEGTGNKIKREIDNEGSVMETGDSVIKSWKFDVLWPTANLDVTPEHIQTYPERQVMAIIEFPRVVCTPIESSADFFLELLYCGHSSGGSVLCDGKNSSSHTHALYSEEMHGFPGRRTMTLRCEFFGQAGDYALTLRPAAAAGPQDSATAFIRADWSDQFVLNVHGGSVLPCVEGVRVLFQYPECAIEGVDRVRVFGRDSDKLRYIVERRVRRGQHTASFDCRLFSERYPEYCFVYVSQAVTGAVADVRMDCLPTSPLSDGGAGGWGQWSPWSACPAPAHCSTRTRSRHRFCDSPPPAYGAKYCEGQAVELAACECSAPPWAGDSSVVVAEVGARCRCGCVLHLAPAARLLAGSARACPARSFWLLQAEEGLVVRLRMEAVKLPCAGQALRARDGDSLGSPLLASWDGPDSSAMVGDVETTTDSSGVMEIAGGRHILVELRSGDTSERCAGGFLAHATQIEPIRNASAAWASMSGGEWWRGGGGARGAAVALAAAAALAALCLALHSAHRTRAYQRAADKESLTDSDACSASLELGVGTAGSRSTLLSEVVGGSVSLRRLLPSGRTKHTRLRDCDRTSETVENRDEEDQASDAENEAEDNESVASEDSGVSQATVTPETVSASSAPAGTKTIALSPLRRCHTMSSTNVSAPKSLLEKPTSQITSPPQTSNCETAIIELSTSASSVSERDDTCSEKDRDSLWEKDRTESRASTTSAATLTNGWYSPALSGVSSAKIRDNPKHTKESCNRRLLKSDLSLTSHPEMEIDYYDYEVNNAGSVPGSYLGMDPAFLVWIPPLEEGDILKEIDDNRKPIYESLLEKPTSQITSPPQTSNCETAIIELSTSASSVSERDDTCSEKDRDSLWEKDRTESRASTTSAATLTNGWYSPALSGVSSAKIRDNPKHTKESCNRRLLKSDLSLTSHPEMEIDYYDYEVNNAGSVPGSYLGMDPAFLVWIPPLEEGDILKEIDDNRKPIYEEILPLELRPDPGSNTESPEERPTSSTLKRNDNRPNRSTESVKSIRKVIEKGNIIHPLNFSISDLQKSPKLPRRNKKKKVESPVSIQMNELTMSKSPVRVHRKDNSDNSSTLKRVNDTARETNADTLKRSDFADFKFADENSDSSNEIKFADDSPDSNRIVDKYNFKV